MSEPIPRLKRGAKPTLLNSEFGNRLIDLVNSLAMMTVSPNGYGKVTVDGKGGAVLNLEPLQRLIADIQKALEAINKSDAQSNPTQTNGGGGSQTVIQTVNQIINSINNSTLQLTCNGDGTISGTLTFPGMPGPITS